MKKKIYFFAVILFLSVTFTGCEQKENVQEDFSKEAMNAYKEILMSSPSIEGEHEELSDASFDYDSNQEKFGNHYDEFALYDINQDGVPELFALSVVNFRWTPISFFTFEDGKTVLLKDPLDEMSHGTFEDRSTANGAYTVYICEDGHIHNVWRGTNPIGEEVEENNAYTLDGRKLNLVQCNMQENEKTIYFSEISNSNTKESINEVLTK